MSIRRVLSVVLAGALAVGTAPALFAQTPEVVVGVISGNADDTAKKPYVDYTVQLRDISTGQIAATAPLNDQAQFSFSNIELSKRFLVELVNTKIDRVMCTEGPYVLATPNLPNKTDVNIDCGATPAAWWLLLAGVGTAAAIGTTVASPSGPTQ